MGGCRVWSLTDSVIAARDRRVEQSLTLDVTSILLVV